MFLPFRSLMIMIVPEQNIMFNIERYFCLNLVRYLIVFETWNIGDKYFARFWVKFCVFLNWKLSIKHDIYSGTICYHINKVLLSLRGPGVPTLGWSKSSFLLFLIEGSPSYQILFTKSKYIDQSYRIFKSWIYW